MKLVRAHRTLDIAARQSKPQEVDAGDHTQNMRMLVSGPFTRFFASGPLHFD